MKAVETITAATPAKNNSPYFSKDSERNFFGSLPKESPFFSKAQNRVSTIQPKLTIGQPNDKYEEEADAMAERVVQTKAITPLTTITPLVQEKCATCEEEDKLQKKEEDLAPELQRKPIFESNTEQQDNENIQRKCAECDKEDEKIQRKEIETGENSAFPSIESRLNSSKSSGAALSPDVNESMSKVFTSDFSEVRIHNDSSAVQLNEELNAQAFTHGNHIYFNSGKYNPESSAGKKLLAHELTHTIQQGGSSIKPSAINNKETSIQRYPKAGELIPITEKQKRHNRHRNDVIDIFGKSNFNPAAGLGNYIASRSEMGQEAAVNIKFGSLGEGFIFVKLRGTYLDKVCTTNDFLFLTSTICMDIPPNSINYYAEDQVIPIKHNAFKQDDKGSLVLLVSIKAGVIHGKLGWVNGKKADDIHPLISAATNLEAFLPLIYGTDYDGKNYTSAQHNNKIAGGELYFHALGELKLANEQKIQGIFYINNSGYRWQGNIPLAVNGLEDKDMPIERTDHGKITGKLPSLQLNKSWNYNDMTASLHASYINGVLEIIGQASYVPKDPNSRIKSAKATIMVIGKENAWDEVRQHLPTLSEEASTALPVLYKSGEGLTVVGWGSIDLSVIKKEDGTDLVTGQAGLVLDPDGHLTVSGKIRVKQIYELMAAKGIDWKPISAALVGEFGPFFVKVPGIPAGLNFTGKGGLFYKYIFGPLTLHDISIQGIYSTNSKVNKELSISGRINLSTELNGKADVTGRMAARVGTSFRWLGFDVSAVELNVIGEASLKSYLDLASTFGVREVVVGKQKVPRSFIKGTIQLAGELSLGLQGTLHFEVLYGNVADTTLKGSWPVENAGVAIDFDYNIGDELSKEKLAEIAKFRKASFNRETFVKGVVRDKTPKGTGSFKGSFEDDKGKKIADAEGKPIPIPIETVTPAHIKEDFNMQGEWHYLDIEIGAAGEPVTLKMATTPALLADKIRAQRENAVLRLKTEKDDSKRKDLEQMIADLDDLQQGAADLIHRAQKLGLDPKQVDKYSIPGFMKLGKQISDFGKRYKLNNLGAPSGSSGGTKPSKDIGDGSYDYPIRIRWVKRGYHSPISLQPLSSRWGKIKPPPAIVTTAKFNENTKLEVPPTQSKSFPHAEKENRDGLKILIVKIGVDYRYQAGINDKIRRVRSSGKRSMSAKFRRLLSSYQYNWDVADPQADHVLDLGWGGPDEFGNLWPLYKGMNEGANAVYKQSVEYIENGEIKTGIPYELRDKWFIIVSIGDTL